MHSILLQEDGYPVRGFSLCFSV